MREAVAQIRTPSGWVALRRGCGDPGAPPTEHARPRSEPLSREHAAVRIGKVRFKVEPMKWRLRRDGIEVVLVVERLDGRGYQARVCSRTHARACLSELRRLVSKIDTRDEFHGSRIYLPEAGHA